jgi:hypothetical protein
MKPRPTITLRHRPGLDGDKPTKTIGVNARLNLEQVTALDEIAASLAREMRQRADYRTVNRGDAVRHLIERYQAEPVAIQEVE